MVDEIPTKDPHAPHGSERSGKPGSLSDEQADALAERFKPAWSVEPGEPGQPGEPAPTGATASSTASSQTRAEPQRRQRQITMLGLAPPSSQHIQAAIRELDAAKGAEAEQPGATGSPTASSDGNAESPARAGSRQATVMGLAPQALNEVPRQPTAVATGSSSAGASAMGSPAAPYVSSSLDDDFDVSQLRRGRRARLLLAAAAGVIAIGLAALLPGPAEDPDERPPAADERELAVGIPAQPEPGPQNKGQDPKETPGAGDSVNAGDEQASPGGRKEPSDVGMDTSKAQENDEQLAAKVRTSLDRAEAPRVTPKAFPEGSHRVRKSSAAKQRVSKPTAASRSRAGAETKRPAALQQQSAPPEKPDKTQTIVREAPF